MKSSTPKRRISSVKMMLITPTITILRRQEMTCRTTLVLIRLIRISNKLVYMLIFLNINV